MHTVIPLQSHWVSTQMGGITVGYKTLILSTQLKQGKVHRSDWPHCNPTQRSSATLPVFPLQCFHRNGWTPSGVRNFTVSMSVSEIWTPSTLFISNCMLKSRNILNLCSKENMEVYVMKWWFKWIIWLARTNFHDSRLLKDISKVRIELFLANIV